jgi:2-methylcitrate dehydratase PrpD
MTLTQALAERAVAPASAADLERLRTLTLTNLAAGLGNLGSLRPFIDRLPLDDARPGDAAFRHAMRLHARTQDDFHPGGRVHVGAVTLAATLALADCAASRLLDCLAAGYETMCAVAVAYSREAERRGYRPTGVFGPMGAAAAAAVALDLDRDGIANAIGLAAARSGGTLQSWLSGTDEWLLEAGAAARAGVEAALFTEAGAMASPDALEGAAGWTRAYFDDTNAARLADAIAWSQSYTAEVAVKPYPVSGIAQVPTDLACRAHADVNGTAVRLAVVRLSEAEAAYPGSLNKGPFSSRSDALMSISFCVACGLADGRVGVDRLERPNALNHLTSAVRVEADDALGASEAVLVLDIEGARREYVGEGASLLFPSWESLATTTRAVALRSEADAAAVDRLFDELALDRPDARALGTFMVGVA